MRRRDTNESGPNGDLDRRAWMAWALAACVGGRCRAQQPGRAGVDEDAEVRAVEAVGMGAGLRPFRVIRSRHFLCIGDAPVAFLSMTARDCESVATDYLDHYRAHGFAVALPERRLTVVALADDRSFAAFAANKNFRMIPKQFDPAPAVHGYFSRETDRLVFFDHRPLGPQLAPRAGLTALRALAHEVTHQLTFNSGLLDRRRDVPSAVIEGLAMYGEVRKSSGRTPPGQLNRMRLDDLAKVQRRKVPWIPIDRLLTDDSLLGQAGTHVGLLAYAESWLLVDYLMKDAPNRPGFRAYLDALRDGQHHGGRLDVAREHLGDLGRLDGNLRRYPVQLLNG